MPFLSRLWLVEREGGELFELGTSLVYVGAEDRFVAPAGFVTDLASIPRSVGLLIPKLGLHNKAAVIHDWLYRTGRVSRKDADGILRRLCREAGVGRARRFLMYAGVRVGGWLPWMRYRRSAP